jgi:class 3 adenylate cyclase
MSSRAAWTLAALAFAALTAALHWSFGAPIDFLILETTLGVLFIAAGAVAWWRRPEVRTGPLLTLSGVIWFAGGYTPMPEPILSAIGFALTGLYDLPLAYLLLTFPAERLVGVRALAVAALGLGLLGRSAGRLLLAPHPFTPFGSESGFQSVESPTSWLIAAAALLVAVLGLVRWVRARAFLRRIGWPLFGAGVLAMAMAAIQAAEFAIDRPFLEGPFGEPLDTIIGWLPFAARALIPLGFLAGTLRLQRQRLALAEVALQTGGTSAIELERALSTALADPELAMLRWSDTASAYLDREGRPVALPGPSDSARAVTYIDDDGRPYAAVVHDALLVEERSILGSLRNAARQALRGEDLRAAVGGRADFADLPHGEVTLLFTDIENSTGHLQRLGLRYADLLERHRSMIREAIREHGGREVDAVGDEFLGAFESPSAAARAAVAIQRRLQRQPWGDDRPVAVRIGLHRGTPTRTPSGYVGLDVHRAARIMSAANGGQILASDAVAAAAGTDESLAIRVRRLGPHTLRGLDEPVDVALLEAPDVDSPSVPIRAEPAGESHPSVALRK